MNVVKALARALRSSQVAREDEEELFLFRLKEANYTNDHLERRIIELADGRPLTEILGALTEGLSRVWVTWIKKRVPEALQGLEQKGFIRVEKRPGVIYLESNTREE